MDHLARGWGLLLILAGCSPAKGEPVGVSTGGPLEHDVAEAGAAPAPLLAPNFRTSFRAVARGIRSEHGALSADVYASDAGAWVEDLSDRDAAVGVYLLERRDAGVRFAVGDPRGRTVADDAADAGPSLAACTRCHAGARDWVFPLSVEGAPR